MPPSTPFIIAITFTGLESSSRGGKAYVRIRRTGETEYVTPGVKGTTTATAMATLNDTNFPSGFLATDVVEAGIAGDEHGYASKTIGDVKTSMKMTIACTATSSSTHPATTL